MFLHLTSEPFFFPLYKNHHARNWSLGPAAGVVYSSYYNVNGSIAYQPNAWIDWLMLAILSSLAASLVRVSLTSFSGARSTNLGLFS